MKSIKKADLASQVSVASGMSAVDSREFVEAYFDALSEFIALDGEAKVMKLGTFIKKRKAERSGRNPKTGEPAVIKARNVVLFHPSKYLKAQ